MLFCNLDIKIRNGTVIYHVGTYHAPKVVFGQVTNNPKGLICIPGNLVFLACEYLMVFDDNSTVGSVKEVESVCYKLGYHLRIV